MCCTTLVQHSDSLHEIVGRPLSVVFHDRCSATTGLDRISGLIRQANLSRRDSIIVLMERTEAGAGAFARVHRRFEAVPSWHALIAQCDPYPCTAGTPQMQLYAASYIRAAYRADCAYCVLETVKFACGESCVQNQVAHRTATTDCSAQHAYPRLSFVSCSSSCSRTTLSAHGLASLHWLWRLARPKPRVSATR